MNIDLSKYPLARSVEFYTGNAIQYTYETANLYAQSTSVDKGNNEWGTPLDGSNVYAVAKNVFTYGVTKRDTFTRLSGEDKKVDCNIRLGFSIGDYTAIQLHNEMFRETNTPYTYSTRNCVNQSVLRLANSIDINKFCFNVRVCIADISNSFTIPNSSVIPLNTFMNDSIYDTLRTTGRDGTKFLVYLALSTLWYAENDSQKWKRYVNGARNYYVYPLMQFNNGVSSIIQYGIPGLIIAGARSSSNYQTAILNQNNYNAVNGKLFNYNYQYGNYTISGQRQQFLSSYYDDGSNVYGDTAYSYFSGLDYCFNVENWYDVFNSSDRMFNNYGYIVDENDRKVYFSLSNSSPETMNFFKYFTLEELLKKVASLGCYFTGLEDSSLSQQEFLTNNDVFLGKMYEDGHTDGTYTNGAENANQIQYNFTDMTDSPATAIDTTKPPEEDTENEFTKDLFSGDTSLTYHGLIPAISGNAFGTFYDLSASDVLNITDNLTQSASTFWQALGTATDYKQTNLLDYIISLRYYPFQIYDSLDVLANEMQFGYNSNAKITLSTVAPSYKLMSTNREIVLGEIEVPARSTSTEKLDRTFLDFEPYTYCYLYLPYSGITPLECDDVICHTLKCYMELDLVTGMGTYYVDNEWRNIYTGTCQIGCDISVAGNDVVTQSQRMASAYLNAGDRIIGSLPNVSDIAQIGSNASSALNALSSGSSGASIAGAAGLASAGVAGIASLPALAYPIATSLARSTLDIASAKRAIPQKVTMGSGFGNIYANPIPKIIIQRPAVAIPARYGHYYGYPCNQTYTLNSLSGFTVCDNPDLSGINATDIEKQMIYEFLTKGVYL